MNHLTWQVTEGRVGPETHYGYWEGAKVFSVYWDGVNGSKGHTPYIIKGLLPGFRPDLPNQKSVEEAKAFAERMLQRWVAKRGLLFKSHIVITDAMKTAGFKFVQEHEFKVTTDEMVEGIVKAALEARG